MMDGNNKGSAILEYGLFIAIFISAVVAMQIYIKRAIAGKFKASTDAIGEQFSSSLSNYSYTRKITSQSEERVTPEGETVSTLLEPTINIVSPYTDNFSDKKLSEEKLF